MLCDIGWSYVSSVGKYYRTVFELVNWNDARTRCSELGASSQLVAIRNSNEHLAVQQLISSYDGNAASRW